MSKYISKHYFKILLLVFSVSTILALGYQPHSIRHLLGKTIFLWLVLYFTYQTNKKIFYISSYIIFIMSLLYIPQAIMLGPISTGILISLFETNLMESIEYLLNIPYYIYIYSLLYITLFILLVTISRKKREKAKLKYKNHIILTILLIYSFNKDIYKYIKQDNFTIEHNEIYPIRFIIDIYQLTSFYIQESHELESALSIPSTWDIIYSNPKYKNFILIIGESMRKDYMSSYGYPIETTPFLSKIPGVIFNNYVSAAPNTQLSLKHTLYRKQEVGEFIYTDNIISLANKANFRTYWLSNQGIFGRNDTSASRIGQQANYSFFTKKSFSDKNYFDTVLLEPFKKALTEQKEQTKLIVLHLIGSHPEFCKRLEKQPSEKRFSKEVDCYIETIKQTDHFIATINEILKQNNQPYSVLYFSDHGLSHYKNKKTLAVGNKYKQNYEVPLIKFSSDDVKREYIQAPKSAFHFMGGFAQWLGIQEKHLQQEQNFFSEETTLPIKVFNWQKFMNFEDLDSDPAVMP